MKAELGRSLIELVGVLAITAVMTAGAIGIYNSIRHNQHNTIAAAELREVAKNIKLLMQTRGDYTGLSVDYLVKAGALKSTKAPIGESWTIEVGSDKQDFVIKLHSLSHAECDFFAVAAPTWARETIINGYRVDDAPSCMSGTENEIRFIAR